MPETIALLPVRMTQTAMGLASRVGSRLGGASVLEHAVARAARIERIDAVVLAHRPQERPLELLSRTDLGVPVEAVAVGGWDDTAAAALHVARRWSPAAWRGGLGGATVFDELLPATPLAEAMDHCSAKAAILLGADWPLLDPGICSGVLALHLEAPEGMKVTFSQAPPGLAGVATSRDLLHELARNRGSFASILRYNPRVPTPDPIGRDVCFQVAPEVRGCVRRFVYDTPRSAAWIDALAAQRDPAAWDLTATVNANPRAAEGLPALTLLELTPRRTATGPITPQHHVRLDRGDLPVDLAGRIVKQLGAIGDAVLMLGGLGDALLHPQWDAIVAAARDAGVWSIGVQTDLLCDEPIIDRMLQLPIDVVWVRLNADTPSVYDRVMGVDQFDAVIRRLERLFNARSAARPRTPGLPWIVPAMVKTADTLADLEGFWNRWMHYAGHAVLEPATCGAGLMPDLSPVPMAPPRRAPCRQLGQRMTILSDGRVALCDQDWQGAAALGDAMREPLDAIWRRVAPAVALHQARQWDDLPLCSRCGEWHRP